ncbi:MAG: SDR family NAD(P)-dependent oxidoreductase [Desulfobacterales bacterium]|jgi:NAD(P)-dependent dehydrogenase (short-subunit alcohol dehydrogenase family)
MMKSNNYGRIINVSSTLGSLTDIASPDSQHAEVKAPAYRLSKIILNGITVLLASEVRGTNILVNSTCPGWVRTDIGGDQAPLSPEHGADTPVWLATLPNGGPSGGFFRERQPIFNYGVINLLEGLIVGIDGIDVQLNKIRQCLDSIFFVHNNVSCLLERRRYLMFT